MSSNYVKSILIATFLSLLPFSINAADTSNGTEQSFQTTCVNSWMKRMDDIKDKVDYKNFGEKYCECAAKQPLDTQEAINKTMQLCMSQTLLQDTMDSLENEVGLDKANADDVNEYCTDRFTLVFPKMNDNDKQASSEYCSCAKPKLVALLKTADNMTDKQYTDQINEIAAACSSGVQNPNQATTQTSPSSETADSTQATDTTKKDDSNNDSKEEDEEDDESEEE
ncbi:hypothetical protein [Legionella brunensis]|uniref:Uncharacterized protein n=1 Tax=Legionella brunensis TaxID=29422 RepID=A0A0W0S4H0_9GAMM|nr:hypothetical protein [Legionella brunensis]KTC78390.1 hypothetical protein Lbru_2682 [Legionella brunensis]